jgi:ABC-type transport system involved in multi-copper enzyme maturation permease subunit
MFRPYLAVVVDSFREALASRVLWVLMSVILLVLCVLAPFGYRTVASIVVVERDVTEWPKFILEMRDQSRSKTTTPGKHIVSLMDASTRKMLETYGLPKEGDFDGAMQFINGTRQFRNELGRVIQLPEFHQPEAWKGTLLANAELKPLLAAKTATMTPDEIGRRNRLLLEAAFVDYITPSPPVSFQMRYFTWDLLEPLPFSLADFRQLLDRAVSWVMGFFVGVVGILIAVVVTSSIVPQMFDPGQLNLLLSKPISRSLLFLAKFCGGCAFILLNASALIAGLWLILGVRFGSWNPSLLMAIPIYMFMFAIYFAVSALAGLLWRNTIVSIGVTVLFWLVCFGLGSAKSALDTFYMSKQRFSQLFTANSPKGDTVGAINEMGFTFAWNDSSRSWDEVFVNDTQRQLRPALALVPAVPSEMRPIGPVYDSQRDQLVALQRSMRDGLMQTFAGPRSDEWRSAKGASAPLGAMYLLQEPSGDLLVVASTGLYRLKSDPLKIPTAMKVFGFSLPLPRSDVYQSVGPESPVILTRPAAAAIDRDSGSLALYSRGVLRVLKKNADGRFSMAWEKTLAADNSPALALAFGGPHLLAATDDGRLRFIDAKTGEVAGETRADQRRAPRFLASAPGGGTIFMVTHDGHLWLIDPATRVLRLPSISGQGDISAAMFVDAKRLWVADRLTRVTEYDLDSLRVTRRWSPSSSLVANAYRVVIRPLYVILPKPGELGKTVNYFLSGTAIEAPAVEGRQDLDAARATIDPWAPVWSSGLFIVVMLAIGCLYLERQEF